MAKGLEFDQVIVPEVTDNNYNTWMDRNLLNEMASPEYLPRTKANVVVSDATVIFTYGPLSGGSLQTATYAHHLEKPYHGVNLQRTTRGRAVEGIVRWLAGDEELNDYDEYLASPLWSASLMWRGPEKAMPQACRMQCGEL